MSKAIEKISRRGARGVDPYTNLSVDDVVKISRFGELPNFDDALETLARALFDEAFARSGGNLSETGRLLGLSRSRTSDLKARLDGRPTRARYGGSTRVSSAKFSGTSAGEL
jgi:hypothetical protein